MLNICWLVVVTCRRSTHSKYSRKIMSSVLFYNAAIWSDVGSTENDMSTSRDYAGLVGATVYVTELACLHNLER